MGAGDPVRGLPAAFLRQNPVLPRHRALEFSRTRLPARDPLARRVSRLESLPGVGFSGVRRSALRHLLSTQLALSPRRAGLGGKHAQLAVFRPHGVGGGRRVLAGTAPGRVVQGDRHRGASLGAFGLHHGPVDVGTAALRRRMDPLGRSWTRRLARQSARGWDGLAPRLGESGPAQRSGRASRRGLPGHDRRRFRRPVRHGSSGGRASWRFVASPRTPAVVCYCRRRCRARLRRGRGRNPAGPHAPRQYRAGRAARVRRRGILFASPSALDRVRASKRHGRCLRRFSRCVHRR